MVKTVQGTTIQDPIAHQLTYVQEFIEALDGIDNGISQYPTEIKPNYRNRTDLSSRVGALNPAWNQPADSKTVDVSLRDIPSSQKTEHTASRACSTRPHS